MAALTNLMRTPLLATLIIMVFRQTGGLPESRASLYESFIKLLSGGWDLVKGVLRESKFGERVKLQVLGTLANNLQESRRREFSGQDLKKALNSTMSGPILDLLQNSS
jgi:predicted NACHT family NTPase